MTRGPAAAICVVFLGCGGPAVGPAPGGKTSTTFETTFSNKHVDKVDVLFAIDNSGEMDAWADTMKAAIPDLVNLLLNPNCVNVTTMVSSGPSNNGQCPNPGDKPEFPPVRDLHLGIISTSLGPRGGDACDPAATALAPFASVQAHNDDQAHLLDRSLSYTGAPGMYTAVTEGSVADAPGADPFLYWYPATNTTPAGAGTTVTDPTTLISDFTQLVGGVGNFGCGLPSPLESWYRFLIQPDPYASIVVSGGKAQWSGVDATILQQRHDFLRPDSKVVVVVVSPNDDKEIDVRSLAGVGYNWLDSTFQPPRGLSICLSSPDSPQCMSCAQGNNSTTDANCKQGPYLAPNDWGFDLRLRFAHMKEKYGVDPQYPLSRYVNGLTSPKVPYRFSEYPPTNSTGSYVGTNECQNPLFAGTLPDGTNLDVDSLCHAPPGPRTSDLVYYVHIGGVPNTLLHFDPTSLAASTLSDADWVKILGRDPLHGDLSGIDPHMVEDYQPRAGVAPPGSPGDADPINGHDWVTDQGSGHVLPVDLQYACIMPLASPRDCSLPENKNFCDCPSADGSLTADELPPVCDPVVQTKQVAAKAYPTRRELLVAKLLGNQGTVASLCPIHVTEMGTGDPLYGYRPAFAKVLDPLKTELLALCLPQPSRCTVLVQLGASAGGSCLHPTCDPRLGLSTPPADVLTEYCRTLEAQYSDAAPPDAGLADPARQSVCELKELTTASDPAEFEGGTCANATEPGWCYVTGPAAGLCHQTVIFTQGAPLNGLLVHVACSEP